MRATSHTIALTLTLFLFFFFLMNYEEFCPSKIIFFGISFCLQAPLDHTGMIQIKKVRTKILKINKKNFYFSFLDFDYL